MVSESRSIFSGIQELLGNLSRPRNISCSNFEIKSLFYIYVIFVYYREYLLGWNSSSGYRFLVHFLSVFIKNDTQLVLICSKCFNCSRIPGSSQRTSSGLFFIFLYFFLDFFFLSEGLIIKNSAPVITSTVEEGILNVSNAAFLISVATMLINLFHCWLRKWSLADL